MANGVMGFPAAPPPQEESFLQKLQRAMLGGGNNYGGMLDQNAQKAAQQQAMMAMAAQLMQAGGQSDRRIGFGEALGSGLIAGQQARQGAEQKALQSLLIQSQIKKAQQRDRGKLVPVIGADGKPTYRYETAAEGMTPYDRAFKDETPAALKIHEAVKGMSQEDRKLFFETQRSPVTDRMVMVNGVPTWANPITHSQTPMSTLATEADAARRLKEAEAAGSSFGKASGEISAGLIKKGADAKNVQSLLEGADALIDIATGSKTGATRDAVAGFFGYAPESAQAAAELKLLEANLMLQQPRMEGPQSNMDQQLYREMAGQIGDPTVPAATKKATLRKMLELNRKYIDRAAAIQGGGAAPSTSSPKRVRVDAQGNVVQ